MYWVLNYLPKLRIVVVAERSIHQRSVLVKAHEDIWSEYIGMSNEK